MDIISELAEALADEQVRYCHWSGNAAIGVGVLGDNDLDLLVDYDDRERFEAVMSAMGFVQMVSYNEEWFPGVHHYFGYDREKERPINVHLHYNLIIGHDLLGNYHLPVEKVLLDSAVDTVGLKVPQIELEFIVFVVKSILKRRLLSLVLGHPRHWLGAMLGRESQLEGATREKLAFFMENTDAGKIQDCLSEYFPYLEHDLFQYCVETLNGAGGRYSRIISGMRLTRAMKSFERHNSVYGFFLAAKRSFSGRVHSVLRKLGLSDRRKKSLRHGGKIIAFVGGDGAGKTTNIQEVERWFGAFLNVRVLHVGKPPKSLLGFCTVNAFRIWRKLGIKRGRSFFQAAFYLGIARDRLRTFRKAVALRRRGVLVVLDRIPLQGITMMDTPRIRSSIGATGVFKWMAEKEELCHSRIRGVDGLVVMRLDPKIALERRPEDEPDNLLKRSGEIWERKWIGGLDRVVDASQALNDVKRMVRGIVWGVLRKQDRITEIIGVAGSGKSTVANRLLAGTCTLCGNIQMRDHKVTFFKNLIGMSPVLWRLKRKGLKSSWLRGLVNVQTILDVTDRANDKPGLGTVVFDQGVIFLLSFYLIECGGMNDVRIEALLEGMAKRASDVVDKIVWLEASNQTLLSRIRQRQKDHRVKHMTDGQAIEFLEEYRRSFERLTCGELGRRIPVEYVDTENDSVDIVLQKTLESLVN